MFDWLIDYVIGLVPIIDSLGIYVYALLFAAAALESTPVLGTFTPGTLMLLFFGFLVSATSNVALIPCILAATLGAVIGDCLGYVLGKYGTRFFKEHKGLLRISHLEMGKAFFAKHGGKSIWIGRFVGPVRPIVPMVAGAVRMSLRRFLVLNITSAIFWTAALIVTGYYVGESWQRAEHWLSNIGIIGSVIIAAALLRWFMKKKDFVAG